jgi:hypothetical protein
MIRCYPGVQVNMAYNSHVFWQRSMMSISPFLFSSDVGKVAINTTVLTQSLDILIALVGMR